MFSWMIDASGSQRLCLGIVTSMTHIACLTPISGAPLLLGDSHGLVSVDGDDPRVGTRT